jgi:hypothetical protein
MRERAVLGDRAERKARGAELQWEQATTEYHPMTNDWRITRLEHRVHELQTAVVVIIRHLGIEDQVAAAERARLDQIRVRGEVPRERLLELYATRPHS